jgi:hypothetical protein
VGACGGWPEHYQPAKAPSPYTSASPRLARSASRDAERLGDDGQVDRADGSLDEAAWRVEEQVLEEGSVEVQAGRA